jgi:hypothetical protein
MIAFAILPWEPCQICQVVGCRDRGQSYHDGQAYATGDQSLDYTMRTVFERKERRKKVGWRANYVQLRVFSTLTLASQWINTGADPKVNTHSLSRLTMSSRSSPERG